MYRRACVKVCVGLIVTLPGIGSLHTFYERFI